MIVVFSAEEDSDDESGKSWSELEEEAAKADRQRGDEYADEYARKKGASAGSKSMPRYGKSGGSSHRSSSGGGGGGHSSGHKRSHYDDRDKQKKKRKH